MSKHALSKWIEVLHQLELPSVKAARSWAGHAADKHPDKLVALITALQGPEAAKRRDRTYLVRYEQRIEAWLGELSREDVDRINRELAGRRGEQAATDIVQADKDKRGRRAGKKQPPSTVNPPKEATTATPERGKAPKAGGVLRTIYDAVHRPEGATKAEIRKELQRFVAEGRSMPQMEKTLNIQLSRMPGERSFQMEKRENVEGRVGKVYRATYPKE